MFMVAAPNGFSFVCTELGDAVSLADTLAKDFEENTVVIDERSGKVVYQTGN